MAEDKTDVTEEPDASSEVSDAQAQSIVTPLSTIDPPSTAIVGPFVPQVLTDDPDIGDGSASRGGVAVSTWRLHKLKSDRLKSILDPEGSDRQSRKVRKAHDASRRARTERGRKIRRRLRVFIAFLLVALVVGLAYVGVTYAFEMWGGKTIPYVVGLTEGNAKAELEAKGFTVSSETVPSDTVSGHVISLEPHAGLRVDEGTAVHLTVSGGRTLPDVMGMSVDEAQSVLKDAGAKNIRLEYRPTRDVEDRVLEVSPAAGAVFMSTDEVTLVVSQLPRMINVVGEEKDIAMQHLERAGITATVEFERSTTAERMHVVRTTPEADQPIGDQGVKVFLADPLVEVAYLADYFDSTTPHAADFLTSQGFERKVNYVNSKGEAVVGFARKDNVALGFVPEPWLHTEPLTQGKNSGTLSEGTKIDGVRLVIPVPKPDTKAGAAPKSVEVFGIKAPTVSETTARDVMKLCNFQEMKDSCTQNDIKLPAGTNNTNHVFYCCSGETSSFIWTILIKGSSSSGKVTATEIAVSCAPRVSYASLDLSAHGGAVCDYVAYQDEYK